MASDVPEVACGEVCRRLFEDLSLPLVETLETHRTACDVEFVDHPAVTFGQMQDWEAMHRPFVLPEDYRALLEISNGITVRWKLDLKGQRLPFGIMHVNGLEEVMQLPAADLHAVPADANAEHGACVAAFDLDAECAAGRVALLYWAATGAGPGLPPQVWFQDLSCRWHFMASSFTDYFRVAALHLGVPHWQCAFTDAGLSPSASQWLALFCPERLTMAAEQSPAVRGRLVTSQVQSPPPRWSRLRSATAASAANTQRSRPASGSRVRAASRQRDGRQEGEQR